MQLHLLSILVSNRFGVLMRVTTIFSRRTFNIKSLTVAETENPDISRITILFETGRWAAEQVEHLLMKLEDVIKAVIIPVPELVSRELLLIKMRNTQELQAGLADLWEKWNAKVISLDAESVILQYVGEVEQVTQFIGLMEPYGAIEICRTGATALSAGKNTLYEALAD